MLNDTRVRERHASRPGRKQVTTWETHYRYFLGVKWSQVQILSARPQKPALTSVGAGFMLQEFLADVWQWAASVPSRREWTDASSERRTSGVDGVIRGHRSRERITDHRTAHGLGVMKCA